MALLGFYLERFRVLLFFLFLLLVVVVVIFLLGSHVHSCSSLGVAKFGLERGVALKWCIITHGADMIHLTLARRSRALDCDSRGPRFLGE